jgi:hypothetical protein
LNQLIQEQAIKRVLAAAQQFPWMR